MSQAFILKEYGKLSLFEQDQMPAEERNWWVRRLEQEYQERQKKSQGPNRS